MKYFAIFDKCCDNILIVMKDWKYFFHAHAIFSVMWLVVTTGPPVVLFGKKRVTNLSEIQIVEFILNINSNAQICILIL